MKIKGLNEYDICNYKLPSMFLISSYCDFKCCHEGGFPESVCQNEPMIKNTIVKEFDIDKLCDAYIKNDITKSIVFGGLEPLDQFVEILKFIKSFRQVSNDDIIIYTGYYKHEIEKEIDQLKQYDNIIIKFGRYKPGYKPHYDSILGIELASDNQYGEKIS